MAANDMVAALQKPTGMDGLFGAGAVPHLASGKGVPMPQQQGGDMAKLILVRHGATHLNDKDTSVDRIRGWKDVPLSDEGRQEAERVGKQMKSGHLLPDMLVPSDLERARETAKIISKITGTPLGEPTQVLRPWNVGELAGQVSTKAIPILAEYAAKKPDEVIPGGESFNTFKARFMSGLSQMLERNRGTLGIVTHHRNERLLKAWAKGGFNKEGNIDISEFNKKGEHTGSSEEMEIPLHNLAQAADKSNG